MPDLTSSAPAIAARTMLRRYPAVKRSAVAALALGRPGGYERRFSSEMLSRVRPGDRVWDVGANVGLYSELFAAAVGPSGRVLSFEPAPASAAVLAERIRGYTGQASWEVVPVALSDSDGGAWLSTASGDTAPDNHLASPGDGPAVAVRTQRGDSVVAAGERPPSLIKIDVEGFEGEVLDGMGSLLRAASLHTVCAEIHFGQLAARGKSREPARIVARLRAHGFTVKWADMSHLIAQR